LIYIVLAGVVWNHDIEAASDVEAVRKFRSD